MIRTLSSFLVFTLLSTGAFAETFKSPDILIDTKLNSDWSGMLVSKLRRMVRNQGYPDPFRKKFEKPVTVYKSEVNKFLNPEAKELLTELGHFLDMDFLNGEAKVVVHGLHYSVRNFKTDLNLTDESASGVTVASEFGASKVKIDAEKVVISLVIPGKHALPVISIEILKPSIIADDKDLIRFFTKIKIKSQAESFQLQLQDANFDHLAQGLLDCPSVSLDFEGVVVPKVSIKVGSKELKFDQHKIESLIMSKKEGIKGILLAQVSSILSKGFGTEALHAMDNFTFPKEYMIESSTIQSYLKINSFKSFSNNEHVLTQLDGEFCTLESYVSAKKECIKKGITTAPKSRITEDDHAKSLEDMRDLIEEGDANIVVSVSEDYINKVLATSLDAGLWNESLQAAGVRLGSNKPFFRLDDRNSSNGTLYMDMIFVPTKMQQIALGSKEVRFPLVLKTGLKITKDKKVPIFTIHVADIDTSDEVLLKGKPELGVVSNIHELRLKKKVLEALRAQTKSLMNKDVVSLRYPELRGLDLDKVDFTSDGRGRMNALIRLRNVDEEEVTATSKLRNSPTDV